MSRFNTLRNSVEPDQIYFDINVSNFQSANTKPLPFYYNESRTVPYINNPEEYYLSVLRFTVDSGTVPVLIPSIQPSQADPNLTIYSVSMSWDIAGASPPAFNQQVYISWSPQDKSISTPLPPSQTFNNLQNNTTGYYNCYSYTYFSQLITLALNTCFTALKTAVNTAYPNTFPASLQAPIFSWDTTVERGIITANTYYYDLNYQAGISATYPINIYMNQQLFGLFSTFPATILGYGQANGKDVRLNMYNVGGTNIQAIIPPQSAPVAPATYSNYLAICLYQETTTTANISPITAFVITSQTLPMEQSQVSTPTLLNNNVNLIQTTNNSATAPIVTDLVIDNGDYSPNLVYRPTAQYRLVTLYGNAPLHNIDFQIYYRLRDSSLVPFILQSGGSVTLKLGFLKKSANNTKFF
jgi:hypothetical protein